MNKNKKKILVHGMICWLITIVFLILPFICLAEEGDNLWGYDGIRVAASNDDQKNQKLVSDGSGGAIIIWDEIAYNTGWIYAQRLDEDGVCLWTVGGVELATFSSLFGTYPVIASDEAGGAIIAWNNDGNIYAQKINASGTLLWDTGGVLIGTGGYISAISRDGSGGAFIVFSLTPKIIHINSSGVLTSPGVDGISLGGGVLALGDPVITLTGTNEVIVAWSNGAKNILAQKVTSALTLPWGATPVLISGNARKDIRPEIGDDGAGGAIITWARHPESGQSDAHVVVQRIDSEGVCLWTPGGGHSCGFKCCWWKCYCMANQ